MDEHNITKNSITHSPEERDKRLASNVSAGTQKPRKVIARLRKKPQTQPNNSTQVLLAIDHQNVNLGVKAGGIDVGIKVETSLLVELWKDFTNGK